MVNNIYQHGSCITIDGTEFIFISGGTFAMGSHENEGNIDEHPQHIVNIAPFFISKNPTTQLLYYTIMNENPSLFKMNSNCPVENTSWLDAMRFCNRYSDKYSIKARLPFECEWEYSCKAGTNSKYFWGNCDDPNIIDKYVWYGKNSNNQTQAVGHKLPNSWGIYDMCGNVWEWCMDWYDEKYYSISPEDNPKGPTTGKYKVMRGGSWSTSICVRSAFRTWGEINQIDNTEGFRIVIEL
ncbi:MAG: formylglycine-generating enzyme family protein [Spirochaetes bacterium]|nr:MAG: formylglycine-generating enzyme family protein [Spirochaetota bacterium]